MKYYWLAIILLSAALATTADLWVTRLGAGASGDAVHYMQGASNLMAGNGFSRLKANGQFVAITGFPPGFSMALAGLGLTGLPLFAAGRILNAILFGLNTFLVGWLIYRATRSDLLAILASWLFMYALNIAQIHTWVMSEPLFIFLCLLSVLLLDIYLRGGKLVLLILAALGIAFASLTRYVGLALIPTACIAILLLNPKKTALRWRDAVVLAAVSLAPVILWFWRNAQVSGNLVNRQLIYHPISKSLIFTLFDELSYWWFAPSLSFPWKLRWSLLLLFALVGAGIYAYSLYKQRRDTPGKSISPIPLLTGMFAVFYLLVLLVNTSFIDASTDEPSIRRYAIPLVVMGIVWTLSTFSLVGRSGWSKMTAQGILILAALGMTLFYASKSVPFVLHPGFAFGYTDDRRNWTCEVDMLKALDPQQATITNNYEEYYFLAGRPAYTLTGKYDPYLNKYVTDFSTSLESVENMLQHGAILALIGDPDQYPNEVNALIDQMGLTISQGCTHLRLYTVSVAP